MLNAAFAALKALTVGLQKQRKDILSGVQSVSNTIKVLRDNLHDEPLLKKWFKEATQLTDDDGQSIRIADKQLRTSFAKDGKLDVFKYFRDTIATPYLTDLIQALETRFGPPNDPPAWILSLAPEHVRTYSDLERTPWCDRILQGAKKHSTLFSSMDFQALRVRLQMWWAQCREDDQNKFGHSFQDLLSFAKASNLTELVSIFQLAATLPLTTTTVERSFSTMRFVKTYLRNTMTCNRLSALTLMYSHHDLDVDVDELLAEYLKEMRINSSKK